MKTYYYYLRDEDNHPRITICLIRPACGFGDKYHRGISMCSYSEKKIDKAYGRKKAYSRAVHAHRTGVDSLPTKRYEAVDIMCSCTCTSYAFEVQDIWVDELRFKSQYNVTLTAFEKKLVGEKI